MESAASVPVLVSVITPVYNGSAHIADCIESVARSLTFGDIAIEHIVVDDGSTDGSAAAIEAAIVANALGAYSGRLLRIGHSGKPSYARNRAIQVAEGKYIFCLDHDDVLLQNSLRYLAGYLEKNASEVVYGDFVQVDGALGYQIGHDYYGWPHRDSAAALYSIFRGEHFYQHSFMFNRSLWELVGGYDDEITYGEDLDLCIRFMLHGRLPQHVPVTTHLHRNHGRNMTAVYGSLAWLAERKAHYRKYRTDLRHHLTAAQIGEVEDVLGIRRSAL